MIKQTLPLCLLAVALSTSAEELHVYAASSMTNAVGDLATQFEKNHQDVKVTPVYASSSSLARQIENGAPADVFISANEKWVSYLKDKKIIAADHVDLLATNKLVLIEPKGDDAKFDLSDASAWVDALQGTRLAIGNTQAVPAGIYGKETLEALKVWPEVEKHTAPTNNVRIALALVERSESKLGIVYKTDALQSDKVAIAAEFDDKLHTPIRYPMATLNDQDATKAFGEFLKTAQARQVLAKYGFN